MTIRWPQPDFLLRRRRLPLLAWVWLATGALVLVATFFEARGAHHELDAQRARLANANQRLARAPAPLAPPLSGAATAKPIADAARAAQVVASQLQHPWGQILSSVESETPAGVQWLLFEHASGSPELRFEGVATDIPLLLQLVDMLSARAGWSEVAIARLQAADTRDGATGWRFEIGAVVDARRIAAGHSNGEP